MYTIIPLKTLEKNTEYNTKKEYRIQNTPYLLNDLHIFQ